MTPPDQPLPPAAPGTSGSPDSDGWQPPPLPHRLTDPVPPVLVGSALWAVAAVVLAVLGAVGARPFDAWFVATLIGVGLGVLGLGILALQRRSGARGV